MPCLRPRPRRLVCLLAMVWLAAGLSTPAWAAAAYRIDQGNGTIGFVVGVAGVFTVEGRFPRFTADLVLDTDHPERSRIEVLIDTAAVAMPLEDQTELLRSDAYFNTGAHPQSRFISTAIEAVSATRYVIHGLLSIRGVTLPQVLDAELAERRLDPVRKIEVADLRVGGQISRGAFGMVADRSMVADTVRLDIRIHLDVSLGPAGR